MMHLERMRSSAAHVMAAAFPAPGADSMTRDVLGGERQLPTIQIDFIQPARVGCIGETRTPITGAWARRPVAGSTSMVLDRDRTF